MTPAPAAMDQYEDQADAVPHPSAIRYFAATTAGLTATRWLSHVLASHPQVYVAHGKFALDSVKTGAFQDEKQTANEASLTRGNETRTFYEGRPLEEVLALYRGVRPGARAYGCVHSYTLHTLASAAARDDTLAGMAVVNVVRHPVDFIASHEALVRAAENHPRLYEYYLDEVFPAVLRQFPELFLMKCPDYRAFIAFALSCNGVNNLLYDMCYPGVRHLKMETLTSNVEVLEGLCTELTGLAYPRESLDGFIAAGAINQHRPGKKRSGPRETYAAWESWQQDMAHTMISGLVLDWLEGLGYDLSMLREPARPAAADSAASVPCLADCLRMTDQRHPLLAHMTSAGRDQTQAIAVDYHGYRLVWHEGKLYALAGSLELENLAGVTAETLLDYEDDGLCLGGESMAQLWRAIALVLAGSPRLVGDCRGYNLINFRGSYYAAKAGVAVNLERLRSRERKQLEAEGALIVGATLATLKKQVEARTTTGCVS